MADIYTICSEGIDGGDSVGTQLDCGHSFHVNCIVRWFRYENTTCHTSPFITGMPRPPSSRPGAACAALAARTPGGRS